MSGDDFNSTEEFALWLEAETNDKIKELLSNTDSVNTEWGDEGIPIFKEYTVTLKPCIENNPNCSKENFEEFYKAALQYYGSMVEEMDKGDHSKLLKIIGVDLL